MRSMTGYGRGEGDNGALKIVVEVKAVNHRYSEITIKQPRMFLALEDKMKKVINCAIYVLLRLVPTLYLLFFLFSLVRDVHQEFNRFDDFNFI